MQHFTPPAPQDYVDAVGYVVFTERLDSTGRVRACQHSTIYRRESDAQAVFGRFPSALPGETVRQTIITVRTIYPMADVLAGNATSWDEYEMGAAA